MSRYKPAGMHVVHQNIVGEVIIVDLQAGTYFSLTDSAATIFDAMMRGLTREDVISELAAHFEGSEEQFANATDTVIDKLLSEHLIVQTPHTEQIDCTPPRSATFEKKKPFVPPTINKYSDMEDILVLDPIHDFDDAGWPNVRAADTNAIPS